MSSGKKGLVISETSSPKSLLRPETSARAWVLGTKSSFSITSQTRLAILGLTVLTRLIVRETVAIDTLARRAMVRISMRSGGSTELFFLDVGRSVTGPPRKPFSVNFKFRPKCILFPPQRTGSFLRRSSGQVGEV